MEKIKFFILLSLFGTISMGANAEIVNGECGIEAKWTLDTETGCLYVTGQGDMKTQSLSSPSSPWNSYKSSIISVVISDDITSISAFAFQYCSNLISVYIGSSVKSIGTKAFGSCYNLKTINFPNSIITIGDDIFDGCSNLPVTEFENLRYLGPYLVGAKDKTQTSYSIKNGTKFIGSYAFKSCTNAKSIDIPETVTYIGSRAFYECSSLTSINIPNSVITIGQSAFFDCNQLIETIDNLKYIDTYLYGTANNSLETYRIKEGTRFIGQNAFSMGQLTHIEIPASVVEIQFNAFYGCTKLTSVTFEYGAQLQVVGEKSFGGCASLQSINLPADVTEICNDAFKECTSLNSVQFGDKIANIGENAFYHCSMISSPLFFPSSIHSIGENAFCGCAKIPSIQFDLNSTITSLSYSAFRDCISISEITIPKSIIKIDNYAFCRCDGLTKLTFEGGSSLEYLGDHAFYGIPISTLLIPKTVKYIGPSVFSDCAHLDNVYVSWKEVGEFPTVMYNPFERASSYGGSYSINLYIPIGTTDLYNSFDFWKNKLPNKYEVQLVCITNNENTKEYVNLTSNGEFEINDEIKNISIDGVVNNVNITYTRNFEKAGGWQAWYMPFDVAFDDMKKAYDVAQIHGVLLDKDNNAVLAFLKLDKGMVKANTPYVVRPKASGEVVIETTTDLQPTVSKSFDLKSATDIYYLGGVYEKTTTPGNWYALNLDGQFQLMDNGVYLRPFRIYMTIDPRKDNPYAQSAPIDAKMDIVVLGDGEATGIESLTPALSQGEGVIYNLNGQRVTSIKSGQIYIMNGKKYIAK